MDDVGKASKSGFFFESDAGDKLMGSGVVAWMTGFLLGSTETTAAGCSTLISCGADVPSSMIEFCSAVWIPGTEALSCMDAAGACF
jgi:hypothetical protein